MRKKVITAAILTSCAGATTAFGADINVGANTTVGGEFFADFSHIQLQNETGTGGAELVDEGRRLFREIGRKAACSSGRREIPAGSEKTRERQP